MQPQADDGILEEFRVEFLNCWRRLPNKAFFFALLVGWLALFQFLGNPTRGFVKSPSLLVWMYSVYHPSPLYDDAHGYIIPFLVLGILWWRRKELLQLPLQMWTPGLALFALGLLFHLIGYRIQQPRICIVGLFTGLYGLTGMAWGPLWLRRSFFPFVLFIFCVPLGTLTVPVTFRLRILVCRIVEAISQNILSIDVVRDGTNLMDPSGRYHYDVAPACSGIRSLIATILLATVYSMVSFRAWWKRGLLIASAVPLAVIGNVVRMMTIIIAAEMGGQEWGNAVHDGGPGGIYSLLPYVPPFLGLLWLGHLLRDRSPDRGTRPPSTNLPRKEGEHSSGPILSPGANPPLSA
jgi:exosortase